MVVYVLYVFTFRVTFTFASFSVRMPDCPVYYFYSAINCTEKRPETEHFIFFIFTSGAHEINIRVVRRPWHWLSLKSINGFSSSFSCSLIDVFEKTFHEYMHPSFSLRREPIGAKSLQTLSANKLFTNYLKFLLHFLSQWSSQCTGLEFNCFLFCILTISVLSSFLALRLVGVELG